MTYKKCHSYTLCFKKNTEEAYKKKNVGFPPENSTNTMKILAILAQNGYNETKHTLACTRSKNRIIQISTISEKYLEIDENIIRLSRSCVD